MRRILLLSLLFLLPLIRAYATHNVAGDITYKATSTSSNCHEYEITVTTYTDMTSTADRCSLEVFFGDGTSAIVDRSNLTGENDPALCTDPFTNTSLGCNSTQGCGIGVGPNYPTYKKNYYHVKHTYPGSNVYIISIKDPNRVKDICNIINSINDQFYLQSELVINDILQCNQSSPLLNNIPLDKACVGQCFYHNPAAYDLDGDSLSYSLSPCMDTTQLPLTTWSTPPTTPGGTLSIDPVTGLMQWCSPSDICLYNICIKVTKWRKWFGQWYEMGYVIRDMQIRTSTCHNDNPTLDPLPDLCVLAGTHISFKVTGRDAIASNRLNLSGSGDAFNVVAPAASFPTVPGVGLFGSNPISNTFTWQTTCDHIRKSAHQATFRLENNDSQDASTPVDLLAYATVNITVIAPAPTNLTVTPQGQTMHLQWNPETCNGANPFVQYEIYRKIGQCDTNPVGPCVTGVPPAWGYSFIGTTPVGQINATTYIDNNNGLGLIAGVSYSYRVVALYKDGAESQPSNNACAALKRDIPVITNVDVDSTSTTAGKIILRWINPIPNKGSFTLGLDTVAFPGPYQLKIYRSPGFSLGSNPVLIQTINSTFIYNLADSLYDLNLDTYTGAWTYRVDFYGGNPAVLIGATQQASSVFLSISPTDNKLNLSWQQNVPWSNYKYKIFKNDPSSSTPFSWSYIGSTSNQTFADSNLINRHLYCYYVQSFGSYFNPAIPDTLLNRSQRTCMSPVDNVPPCPPILHLASDCQTFRDSLVWSDPNHFCADDVVTYNIWFAPSTTGPMAVVQTIGISTDTIFVFDNLNSVAGCYAVTALDSNANQSVLSNTLCVDNCPFYALPNVFTPNGDNLNDYFNALPYRYVKSVDMKIYDRWGVLLFQTSDPHIHWDGKAMQTGQLCTDGVYYYVCTVNSERLQGIVPFVLTGFLQLISTTEPNH